jgi:protein-tyrosine phosphatase
MYSLFMKHRLLFLCTANYYRSRFAELLFNALAAQAGLDWEASSRGIATDLGADNVGPISAHVVTTLQSHGIRLDEPIRDPLQLEERDMEEADLIIALHEEEHRPYLAARFPRWPEAVEYWHVPDLDARTAADALNALHRQIRTLIRRLIEVQQGQNQ